MTHDYYEDEDFRHQSPGLEQVFVRAAPSPSPSPQVTKPLPPVSSPSSSRRQKKANRRKTRPTQGDWVLIREMAPNQPDIAHQVSLTALNSDSMTESEGDDDDMENQPSGMATAPSGFNAIRPVQSGVQPFVFNTNPKDVLGGQPTATSAHRDSVVEPDVRQFAHPERRASEVSPLSSVPNGLRHDTHEQNSRRPNVHVQSASPVPQQSQRRNSVASMQPPGDTRDLHQLQIPGPPSDRLPMIQPSSPLEAGSPASQQQIPSISQMIPDLPRSASISEDPRANGLVHRASISSITASPTARVRQMSISSHTPASPIPPFSASSPMSANSDVQRGDLFLQNGSGHVFGSDNRRPSQVSSNGRYPSTLHSASTSEGYQSSDGPSPGSQQTPVENRPRHMSLDGTLASSTIHLPPPIGSGLPLIGSLAIGSFRCDYPGCNAMPFQTQYLLNSHTNVHSQNRPHYCPVSGCPRSEGGKGFKRKNEMIRHGLVHQSPGYVCPFCPDREHKYPRPDNLQRHVRVHHVDRDKDDPQLRDVLAQRPEGGSRGRRRRS